ncbi:conjugal transfer protein TraG, partial [Streptomyces sp. G35A]
MNNLYALSGAGDRLDTWIATGGMLASATPVISLFIVTGSTYAFTTLASKVSGADHLNEKMATPDALQNGPVASMMPTFSGNQFSGLVREGTQGMMASGSFGGSVSAGVNSSQTKMQQAQQQYAETLGRSITDGASESTQFSRLASLGSTIG